MDAARIQQKVYFGYGKAAQHIGLPFNQYRSAVPIDPIDPDNLLGSILASANVSWNYMKANKYGNAVWQFVIDGRQTQRGDYFVGEQTFYIASQQSLLPIQAIECNHALTISRPTQSIAKGNQGYVADMPSTRVVIMQNMPASMLQASRTEKAIFKLPTEDTTPRWNVLLPNLGNVSIEVNDHVVNEAGEEFIVINNELTELGFRLICHQVVNN